jgi:hypothetical protein
LDSFQVLNVICMALTATRWYRGCAQGALEKTKSIWEAAEYIKSCSSYGEVVLGIAVIFFLATLGLFFLYLLCVPDKTGGRTVWDIIVGML